MRLCCRVDIEEVRVTVYRFERRPGLGEAKPATLGQNRETTANAVREPGAEETRYVPMIVADEWLAV